jgi:hypothetical protein
LIAANGGTGFASYAVGDLLFASTTTVLSKLADVATGNALISGGIGVAPSYGKIGLTTHISGTLGVGNGGTGVTSSTGTVAVVLSNSPTLVTPVLGAASATSIANALGAVGTPSYTFTGDLNTGMWSPAADTIAFSEGGVEAMRIDSSGNVGIGTTSPGSLLQLNKASGAADLRFSVAGTLYANMYASSSDVNILSITALPLILGTNNTERMRITSAGDVGIGTSSPSQKLHVVGAQLTIPAAGWSAGQVAYNYLGDTLGGVKNTNGGNINVFGYNGFDVTVNGVSPVTAMTVTAGANVGIGTASPGYRLDVEAGDTTANTGYAMRLRSNATATAAAMQFTNNAASVENGLISCTDAGALTIQSGGGSSNIKFRTNGAERASISSDGHFGMGTSTRLGTNETLSVSAISTFDGMWVKNLSAAAVTAVIWNAATSGDNSFISFATEAAATGRGSITYNRAGGLVAYNVTSDYRAKDIIGPVIDAGTTIDALKVYAGKMKGATVVRPMLIAHEAQEVVPYAVTGEKDAVNEDGTDKHQQMDHQSLIPLLIAEIQSLRARVAQLEGN